MQSFIICCSSCNLQIRKTYTKRITRVLWIHKLIRKSQSLDFSIRNCRHSKRLLCNFTKKKNDYKDFHLNVFWLKFPFQKRKFKHIKRENNLRVNYLSRRITSFWSRRFHFDISVTVNKQLYSISFFKSECMFCLRKKLYTWYLA